MDIVATFEDTNLRVIDRDGEPWFTGSDIGRALGYADAQREINKLYQRNEEEFQEDETCIVKLTMQGDTQSRDHRVFSRSGAIMLAIHAKTDRAAAFRRWIVDLLQGKEALPGYKSALHYKRIVEGLQAELLAHFPELNKHLDYAQKGLSWAEIARLQCATIMDVRVQDSVLKDHGFDLPEVDQTKSLSSPQDMIMLRHVAMIKTDDGA